MFSDFKPHRIGGPQVAPAFGVGTGNTIFDGPGENEDFGFEQTEGDPALRYTFRTAPLRNLKVAPAFFHNGAFGTLEAAIAHHLDVKNSLLHYHPRDNHVPPDLSEGPCEGILEAGSIRCSGGRSGFPGRSSVTWSSSCRTLCSTSAWCASAGASLPRCRAACRCSSSRAANRGPHQTSSRLL